MDVRVIVATHRNLDELVKKGVFRQDLYHRIYVFPLLLPPLRERAEDIPALVAHFARQVCGSERLEAEAVRARTRSQELQRYPWPGNVRELRNVVERLLLLADGPVDAACRAPGAAAGRGRAARRGGTTFSGTLAERVDAFERDRFWRS